MPAVRTLSPKEAAERFGEDPASVLIKLDELVAFAGVTRAEALRDLQQGRLKACVLPGPLPDPNGPWSAFLVRGDDAAMWLAIVLSRARPKRRLQ